MYELRVAAHTYFLVYGLLSCLTVDGSRGNSRHCRSGVRPSHVLGVNRLDETSGEICDATTEAKQVQLFRVSGNETNLPQISESFMPYQQYFSQIIAFEEVLLELLHVSCKFRSVNFKH